MQACTVNQRKSSGVFLCHTLSYSLKTETPTEPQLSVKTLQGQNYKCVCDCAPLLIWVLEIEPGSSYINHKNTHLWRATSPGTTHGSLCSKEDSPIYPGPRLPQNRMIASGSYYARRLPLPFPSEVRVPCCVTQFPGDQNKHLSPQIRKR